MNFINFLNSFLDILVTRFFAITQQLGYTIKVA